MTTYWDGSYPPSVLFPEPPPPPPEPEGRKGRKAAGSTPATPVADDTTPDQVTPPEGTPET